MELINWLIAHWADVSLAILAVLGAASAVAKVTPTESDDKVIAAILSVIHTLGLTKK